MISIDNISISLDIAVALGTPFPPVQKNLILASINISNQQLHLFQISLFFKWVNVCHWEQRRLHLLLH